MNGVSQPQLRGEQTSGAIGMSKKQIGKSSVVCAMFLGAVGLWPIPSAAQATNQAQIESLVADIKAHKQSCNDNAPNPTKFCVNEKADLVARQKRIGVSDDAVNKGLQTRGWRWP
jgi:hypothetical protein